MIIIVKPIITQKKIIIICMKAYNQVLKVAKMILIQNFVTKQFVNYYYLKQYNLSLQIISQLYLLMSSPGGLVLREADQNRVNKIIMDYARTQQGILKFSEITAMLVDRCIFCNKFTLGHFLKIFEGSQSVVNNKSLEKDNVQGERIIGRQQLIYIFNEVAKILFKPDPNYLQKFFNVFLSESVVAEHETINRARVMIWDEINKKLVLEPIVALISQYQQQLRNIFVAYAIENYWAQKKNKRLLLNFREILLQNKRWTFTSLILFLKQSETTPHIINIQQIQQSFRSIVPNSTREQQDFYSRHILVDTYHKEGQNNQNTSHVGDPELTFSEFEFLIARIAWQSYPRQLDKSNPGDVVQRYFKYLAIRSNENLETTSYPNFSRKMITKMKEYYTIIKNKQDSHLNQKKKEDEKKLTPVEELAQKMNIQFSNLNTDSNFDFKEIFKNLDKQLPKLPPKVQVVPQVPPPFTMKTYDFITIGQQPPPQPVDKNQKAAKPQKKDAGKKDQPPPRQFKWADVPQLKLSAQDYFKDVQQKLQYETKPLLDIKRGVIPKQGYPTLISETLFPPELPQKVKPYITAASNALNDRNFILALQNYTKGQQQWKKTGLQMEAQYQLYFQYSKAYVYLSAGNLQKAFHLFYASRKYGDTSKLPFSNPDRSLPFFGLGQVLYQVEEYQAAARSFLKAREIRQAVLGLQHVQTATVFNNLGCCFYMLQRSQQALGYFEIAQVVLDTELGAHHERTMTCRNNLKKMHRGTFENQPEYRRMWQVFENDPFQKKKKKKKDKEGKKK